MNNCNYGFILQYFEDIHTLKFGVIWLINIISIDQLAPNSIGFYSGIHVTTMRYGHCRVNSVRKSPGQTNKQAH